MSPELDSSIYQYKPSPAGTSSGGGEDCGSVTKHPRKLIHKPGSNSRIYEILLLRRYILFLRGDLRLLARQKRLGSIQLQCTSKLPYKLTCVLLKACLQLR